ncbi:hypothetical protein [Intestinibacter bartlettii]|uniref:hypothetical protein n=1 Tax=Intestinibacter bartlettii TaxID=261299 RepID=UPI0034A48ECA
MEAEKIFCKNLDQFSKDNDISKNKFYRNIENVISYYGIKKEYIKRDPREIDSNKSGSIRNKDYRIRKLSEPLLTLMIECIIKNKLKNKNSNFEKFSLKSFLDYTEFTLDEIEKLPTDISMQIMDSQAYQSNYLTTKYITIFLDKIEEILNIIFSLNTALKTSTICDIISYLNTIIDLLNYDYNEKNKLEEAKSKEKKRIEAFDKGIILPNIENGFKEDSIENLKIIEEKIKTNENFLNNPLLDDIVKLEFNRLNKLQNDMHSKLKTDINNNPKIYINKKTDYFIDYPEHYYLDKTSKRKDLFLILENESFLSDIFVSSLKPDKPREYIEFLHNTSPDQYSLIDFIDIYKQDAYNQLEFLENKYKNLSFTVKGYLKQIRMQNINNTYFDILDVFSNKVSLAKKYISNLLLYSSKMTYVEFLQFKKIMSFLYEKIYNKKNFNENIYVYQCLNSNVFNFEVYNIAKNISNTEYIEEIINKNNEDSYTYKVDTFLQLYTNDNILSLVFKYMNLDKHNKLKYNTIFDLSSDLKINLTSLIKNKDLCTLTT